MSSYKDRRGNNLRCYCTEKFLRNHVIEGSIEQAKKATEIKTQKRHTDHKKNIKKKIEERIQKGTYVIGEEHEYPDPMPRSSVICLSHGDAVRLMEEVHSKSQPPGACVYEQEQGLFKTESKFYIMERDWNAKSAGKGYYTRFWYKVRKEHAKGSFKIGHFDGVAN